MKTRLTLIILSLAILQLIPWRTEVSQLAGPLPVSLDQMLGVHPAQAQTGPPGTVKSHQKISDTVGGFFGTASLLDDSDQFGFSVAELGDVDGDEVSDLAVGAPIDDDGGDGRGAVWILFMNADRTVKSYQKISDTEGGFSDVLNDFDLFGATVASIGDWDGDTVPDIAVGASSSDDGGSGAGGMWLLFLNTDGTVKGHQKISAIQGGFSGTLGQHDQFGTAIALLDDLNGDDIPELAVGAPFNDNTGQSGEPGAVWILFMNADGTVKDQQEISKTQGGFTGNIDNGDLFGAALSPVDDWNNDGVPDLIVGAPRDDDGADGAGAIWLLLLNADGTVKGQQKISETQGGFTGDLDIADQFGTSVANLGDLDGDSISDFAAGAFYDNDGGVAGQGAVWILFMKADGTVKSHQKISATQGNFSGPLDPTSRGFGYSMASLGDLNGDGFPDVVVGERGNDDGGNARGAVWTLFLNGETAPPPTDHTLLAVYALAFDNDPSSPGNLAPEYWPVLEGLIEASVENPKKTAVVLTDLNEVGDTHIRVIQNGVTTTLTGVPDPDANCELIAGLEYDMSNGQQLGCFIKWARATYPADKTIFSYVSHGMALVPETDINNLFDVDADGITLQSGDEAIPLPNRKGGPDFTDHNPLSLISPYDLAEALRIGTNEGADPLDVMDTVHCFSGSMEEFYELHPYATIITGSPNYAYLDSDMLGQALEAVNPNQAATVMADQIIGTYHATLPDVDHPHLLVAVESEKLSQVKTAWDTTAFHVMDELNQDLTNSKAKILAAYQSSAKYDANLCEPHDWSLAAPDALSDMADFATKLGQQGWGNAQLSTSAAETAAYINTAVVARYQQNGRPWFADADPKPTWDFTSSAGISLYTDFQGEQVEGVTNLGFQAGWYKDEVTATNPHPYTFLQNGYNDVTWGDVFQKFWEGETVQVGGCLPEFPVVQSPGEVSAERITIPHQPTVSLNHPIYLEAVIGTIQVLPNLVVRFNIYQNDALVFSDVVAANYLTPGTYPITTNNAWTPTELGPFIIEVIADDDNRVIETLESNNYVTMAGTVVSASDAPPVLDAKMINNLQWVIVDSIPIDVTIEDLAIGVNQLSAQIYTYVPGDTPNTQIPKLISIQTFDTASGNETINLSLPANLQPGPLTVHIWGTGPSGQTLKPAIVNFNYAPPHRIAFEAERYFLFEAEANDSLTFDLVVPDGQDVNLFVWDPISAGLPTWQSTGVGSDKLEVTAPLSGQYLLGLRGETTGEAQYTLLVTRNGIQSQSVAASNSITDAYIPDTRPIFLEPDLILPSIGQAVFLPVAIKN